MPRTICTALAAFAILALWPDQGVSQEDIEMIKSRMCEDLLPAEADPAEIHRKALEHAKNLRDDGTWEDVDYRDGTPSSWKTVQHLDRLRDMAVSCRLPGTDPAVGKAVSRALDHWLEKKYRNGNWWWNDIGVPLRMGDVLLLMEKDLSQEQRAGGIALLAGSGIGMTGQNMVWLCSVNVVRGCLEDKPKDVAKALKHIVKEIRTATTEGIQPDMSFHQHGPCLYSGGYGLRFSTDCARFAWYVSGTRFAIPQSRMDILSSYILDGQQWMVRGDTFDYGAIGRNIARPGMEHAGRGLAAACEYMARIPGKRQAEFEACAARIRSRTPEAGPVGNRYFHHSAFMVHRRNEYYASVRMLRKGLHATDGAHNGEGLLSHHLSDGVTYILRSGREYADIFPVWNWRMVPGITAVQSPDPYDVNAVKATGIRTFAGAASDGTYGAAAMDFATPRRGKNAPAEQLTARKAWFCFDREFVCLGAGITSSSPSPVVTTVNQRLLEGDVHSSGRAEKRDGVTTLKAPGWLHHDGVGYLFFEGSDARVSANEQTGSWKRICKTSSPEAVTKDVFTIWLDHGPKPSGATYRYVVAPSLAEDEMEAYSWNHGVEFLANSPDLQAVRHRRLKMLMAVFYRPGTLTQARGPSITADRPCILIFHMKEGEQRVTIAGTDTGGKPGAVTITVGEKKHAIDLPAGDAAGSSVTTDLK